MPQHRTVPDDATRRYHCQVPLQLNTLNVDLKVLFTYRTMSYVQWRNDGVAAASSDEK